MPPKKPEPTPLQLQTPRLYTEDGHGLLAASNAAAVHVHDRLRGILAKAPLLSCNVLLRENATSADSLQPLPRLNKPAAAGLGFRNAALAALFNLSPFLNFLDHVAALKAPENVVLLSLLRLAEAFRGRSGCDGPLTVPGKGRRDELEARMDEFWKILTSTAPEYTPDASEKAPGAAGFVLYLLKRIADADLLPGQLGPDAVELSARFSQLFEFSTIPHTPLRCHCVERTLQRQEATACGLSGFVLDLNFEDEQTLEQAISNKMRDPAVRARTCLRCGTTVNENDLLKLAYLPEVFLIAPSYLKLDKTTNLKGNTQAAPGGKVVYPDLLDMSELRDDPTRQGDEVGAVYRLQSIVMSPESNPDGEAHFVAYLHRGGGVWEELDDMPPPGGKITCRSMEHIRNTMQKPRLLAYVRNRSVQPNAAQPQCELPMANVAGRREVPKMPEAPQVLSEVTDTVQEVRLVPQAPEAAVTCTPKARSCAGAPVVGNLEASGPPDPFNLARFIAAQDVPVGPGGPTTYVSAAGALSNGQSIEPWVSFIFPRASDASRTCDAQRFSIGSIAEARAYWNNQTLRTRLARCLTAALSHCDKPPEVLFGSQAGVQIFRESLTLFTYVDSDAARVFTEQAIRAFFGGQYSHTATALLAKWVGVEEAKDTHPGVKVLRLLEAPGNADNQDKCGSKLGPDGGIRPSEPTTASTSDSTDPRPPIDNAAGAAKDQGGGGVCALPSSHEARVAIWNQTARELGARLLAIAAGKYSDGPGAEKVREPPMEDSDAKRICLCRNLGFVLFALAQNYAPDHESGLDAPATPVADGWAGWDSMARRLGAVVMGFTVRNDTTVTHNPDPEDIGEPDEVALAFGLRIMALATPEDPPADDDAASQRSDFTVTADCLGHALLLRATAVGLPGPGDEAASDDTFESDPWALRLGAAVLTLADPDDNDTSAAPGHDPNPQAQREPGATCAGAKPACNSNTQAQQESGNPATCAGAKPACKQSPQTQQEPGNSATCAGAKPACNSNTQDQQEPGNPAICAGSKSACNPNPQQEPKESGAKPTSCDVKGGQKQQSCDCVAKGGKSTKDGDQSRPGAACKRPRAEKDKASKIAIPTDPNDERITACKGWTIVEFKAAWRAEGLDWRGMRSQVDKYRAKFMKHFAFPRDYKIYHESRLRVIYQGLFPRGAVLTRKKDLVDALTRYDERVLAGCDGCGAGCGPEHQPDIRNGTKGTGPIPPIRCLKSAKRRRGDEDEEEEEAGRPRKRRNQQSQPGSGGLADEEVVQGVEDQLVPGEGSDSESAEEGSEKQTEGGSEDDSEGSEEESVGESTQSSSEEESEQDEYVLPRWQQKRARDDDDEEERRRKRPNTRSHRG